MLDLARRKHRLYIVSAIEEARKSSMRCQHGCVIICNGIIVARGHNYRIKNSVYYSVHAEEAAINELLSRRPRNNNIAPRKRKSIESRMTLYVVRIRQNGDLTNSKPCSYCTPKINAQVHISKIFYSSDQ